MKKLTVKTLPGRPFHKIPKKRRFRGRHVFMLLLLAGIGFGAYRTYYPTGGLMPLIRSVVDRAVKAPEPVPEPLPASPPAPVKTEPKEKYDIRHRLVKSGETLAVIIESLGISNEYTALWQKACNSVPLDRLEEDDELIFFLNKADGQPSKVIFLESDGPSYGLRQTGSDWECTRQESAPRGPVKTVRGRYSECFYDSCIAAGLPAVLIASLADIFAYDIDMAGDFKDGDTFAVHFQEQSIEGAEGGQFLILAAEMRVSGKAVHAFGYQMPDGSWDYFDEKGASLKRMFLRSPISYRKLMAPSTYKNLKPILKIYRPRMGIDYAAPRGTPVGSVGDGVISSIKKSGKSAVVIEVRHRGGFRSFYGNLSGYSRGLARGSLVSQGEIIGSVGAGSGKPHLDFRLQKDGKPVNFHTVDFSRSKIIPKNLAGEFEKTRDAYLNALQGKSPEGQKQDALPGRE
ncbi:MAG: M23 family metallopeptidase [Desulfobacteraceae bacterium]|nr:M23 family metallopeptidase [Desulfobacteraceae bacterium]